MKEIPYTSDPEDHSGARCEDLGENGFKCHRRLGHSNITQTFITQEDDSELIIEFNHRAMAAGRFFTW